MPRVVSLIASATEIVAALGCADQLVGRSHECDHPESVRQLPVCTEPKFPVEGWSYEIDERVRAIVQEGLSVYRVHGERLRALQPDVIVTQSHCAVCAVSMRDVEEAVSAWLDRPVQIVSLEPNALADVWEDIRRVARALGVAERGERLIAALRERMDAIAARALSRPQRPRVAFIEWIEPLMAGGNWMPELIERAGGLCLFGRAGERSPTISWHEFVASDPDVILIAPCGFDIERTRRELSLLERRPEWTHLRAVGQGRVVLADGNQFFNRPGPRLVESLEILAEVVHPETFHFGHEGKAWERWRSGLSPGARPW